MPFQRETSATTRGSQDDECALGACVGVGPLSRLRLGEAVSVPLIRPHWSYSGSRLAQISCAGHLRQSCSLKLHNRNGTAFYS